MGLGQGSAAFAIHIDHRDEDRPPRVIGPFPTGDKAAAWLDASSDWERDESRGVQRQRVALLRGLALYGGCGGGGSTMTVPRDSEYLGFGEVKDRTGRVVAYADAVRLTLPDGTTEVRIGMPYPPKPMPPDQIKPPSTDIGIPEGKGGSYR